MFSGLKINGVLVIVFGVIVVMVIISKPRVADLLYLFMMVIYMGRYKFIG